MSYTKINDKLLETNELTGIPFPPPGVKLIAAGLRVPLKGCPLEESTTVAPSEAVPPEGAVLLVFGVGI